MGWRTPAPETVSVIKARLFNEYGIVLDWKGRAPIPEHIKSHKVVLYVEETKKDRSGAQCCTCLFKIGEFCARCSIGAHTDFIRAALRKMGANIPVLVEH